MLFADLADEASRDFLEGVALAEQVAYVPLLAAPVDRSTHQLEVYSPLSSEPLRLYADPVGPPTNDGFPLRLRFRVEESAPVLKAEKKRPATMRARHATSHDLTERHTADLEGAPQSEKKPTDLIGRELAGGKLVIESLIGGGGVGAVYKTRHRDLRIPVAVKVLHDNFQSDADFGRRFHAEALAASRLDHPNVTRVLDFGQEPDGLLYLVMEYLDGVGLRAILEHEKRLSLERIVKLTSQICAGLAHAHTKNIVHKDIKPENLVIVRGHDDDGQPMEVVKVCDFGIAQGAVQEETRRFQGTPEYMSPEQCTSSTLDARSDIYSVGIVMYELATGDVPFIDDDLRRLLDLQIHEPPPPPTSRFPGVDPRLERIILRAIAKQKDARHPTMRDLRADLRALLDKPVAALSGRFPKVPSREELAARYGAPPSSGGTPAPMSAQRPPPSSQGDWLQRGGDALSHIELATGGPRSPRSEITSDPSAFMRRLVGTTDPRQFLELVTPLESAIPELAQEQQIEVLWRLASTLDILATEGPEVPGSRAAASKALLRVLHDPGTLAPVAARVLSPGDATGEKLLVSAGAFGAHALYSARLRATDPEASPRFVKALRAIGPAALPVLRGGLERLADRLGTQGAAVVAEDLLLAMPKFHDEATGAIVASYARSNNPHLARAAAAALPGIWRERSRPIVLGLIDHDHEDVVVAALGALTELGISDAPTPRHVATVLDRRRSRALVHASLRALAQARGEARAPAAALVEARLRRMTDLRVVDDVELALGLARANAILALDKAAAEKLLEEVSKGWPADVAARARAAQAT
ncbi:MAG: serine/threonine protein kinase [Labilithrix sp.]|nr:serine/threonine protein kinase [Labilithrix sp.]MCW5816547.1 serine/threonine protein kinase [Labilithrix sp.]